MVTRSFMLSTAREGFCRGARQAMPIFLKARLTLFWLTSYTRAFFMISFQWISCSLPAFLMSALRGDEFERH